MPIHPDLGGITFHSGEQDVQKMDAQSSTTPASTPVVPKSTDHLAFKLPSATTPTSGREDDSCQGGAAQRRLRKDDALHQWLKENAPELLEQRKGKKKGGRRWETSLEKGEIWMSGTEPRA